ncbi:leukemia inhibitory factor receptor [Triplophysa rosa]|uniref:Leukemia inhibitory factor receptor n=1 Tax=Triplophysa rosa TaxID=992332 RepID=A0A9W7X4A3_TRIRA|nr:leukemia inhibitory factor receptor [Triplophysa rosa]KAI7813666.1 putative leukemia inhibitory factor receptor [Triplophysa rosa]
MRSCTSTEMIYYWTNILIFIIISEHVKRCHSSDNISVPDIVKLRALDMWRMEMKMNMTEEHRNQTYEIQVGRTKNMYIIDRMSLNAVADTVIWTSQMPLNCTDHSVRIRHISDNPTLGSWSAWKTHYGDKNLSQDVKMYPKNQVLKEGSTLLFCCIYSEDAHITDMFFNNTKYKVIIISSRVKAIRVENINATNLYGVSFNCSKDSSEEALNFVTFPPEKLHCIRCETTDVRNITCTWKVRRAPNLGGSRKRMYRLLIRDSEAVNCSLKNRHLVSCSFPVIQQQVTYNITLLVTNSLGREREHYIFNITDTVFPLPERSEVTAGVLDAVMDLQLNGSFRGLCIICQIEVEPGGMTQELQMNGSDSFQHFIFEIQKLQPSMRYTTRGRCATQDNDWGRWTPSRAFLTGPLVTVDVWRQIRNGPVRTVTLLWHTVKSHPEVYIEAYEVCKNHTDPQSDKCINVTQTRVDLPVDVHVCDFTVRAVSQTGLSVPSQITIPSAYTEAVMNEKRIVGNAEGFQLSWTRSSSSTCDYTVEWCMLGVACSLQWRKVPVNQTYLSLEAEYFRPGVRYTFTVYWCNAEGHRPHEKHIGYLEEQKPTQCPTLDPHPSVTWSSVTLKWSFDEDDPNHNAFITGYEITVQRDLDSDISQSSHRQMINKPHSKSFTFSDLEEDRSYTFHLSACSSAGCGQETSTTITTRKNYYLLSAKILVLLLVLVSCCICLCYCQKILREIPEEFNFLHLKALDLDEDLYEASEKIRTFKIEECHWCDVEVLDVHHHTMIQNTWLTDAEDLSHPFITYKVPVPSFLTPSYQLTTGIWDSQTTDLTNFTYVSSEQQDLSDKMFETDGKVQEAKTSGFISDYVTSVAF